MTRPAPMMMACKNWIHILPLNVATELIRSVRLSV